MKCNNCSKMPQRCTHTLTVEKPGTTVDASGQIDLDDDDNWIPVGQIRARFITKGGSESYVYKQVHAETTSVIMTPYTSDEKIPDPSYRLRLGARKFNILAAYRLNETGREVQIEAEERRQP